MTQSRWIAVLSAALFVSLALNIFVAGWVAGHGIGRPGGPGMMSEGGIRLGMQRVLRVLPPDDRKLMEGLFEARRSAIRGAFEALREAREAVGDTLRAEPFDQAAFERAYAEMRRRSAEIQESIHDVIMAAAPRLSPTGRRELAEARWRHDERD
jgi:uncharacterized membrane protein